VTFHLPSFLVVRDRLKDIAAGAQTKRRGGAGPVRSFFDGQSLTGRFCFLWEAGAS
jgi:hypothetical protein